jgi:hypothetical protein
MPVTIALFSCSLVTHFQCLLTILSVCANVVACRGFELHTTWGHFKEDAVIDGHQYSELDPMTAPTWTLARLLYDYPPQGAIGTCLLSTSVMCPLTI